MFKKRIHTQLDIIIKKMKADLSSQLREHQTTRDLINREYTVHQRALEKMSNTIISQQRTIEQLTNALRDKYEHGLFIFSEDCKIPMVIRNGKELTNDLTTHFGIEWDRGETPLINIEQAAGTIADSER